MSFIIMDKIYIINGPNLNLLGKRQVSIYGKNTIFDLEELLTREANGHPVEFFQSNSEADIISYIQKLPEKAKIIINAGAYTHTSIGIRDALLAIGAEFIEVHISNVFSRESFRHHSYLSDIAKGVIVGLGFESYRLALNYFLRNYG